MSDGVVTEQAPQDGSAVMILRALRSAGIDFVASFPDSQISPLITAITSAPDMLHVALSREDEGVGVCAGAYLGGRKPCLLIQNSGLLEAVNDLLSVAVAQELPMLLLIGYRGHFGELHWYHGPAGRVTEPILDLLGVKHVVLGDLVDSATVISRAALLAEVMCRPTAVLIPLATTS